MSSATWGRRTLAYFRHRCQYQFVISATPSPSDRSAVHEVSDPDLWLSVAKQAGWRYGIGTVERVPAGLVHAKKMRALKAACGETSYSWTVFWTQRFEQTSTDDDWCRACQRIVRLLGART